MLHSRSRFIVGTAIATLALLAPLAALAQPAETAQDPAPSADADAQANNGEILVTAQRRTERLRDVPITITYVSGAQLQEKGITTAIDLPQVTPGLRIDRAGANVHTSLRGVSTTFTGINDSPVAFYIDGVYQQSLPGLNIEFADVRDVQVLKGPQGTLFGRNATGGAIQIFTRDPEFQFGGNLNASYGRFNDVQIDGFVTGPLSDQVAISLSGGVHNNDGFYHNIDTDKRVGRLTAKNVRGKILFKPTDDLTVKLTGFYTKRYDGSSWAAPLNGNIVYGNLPIAIVPRRPYDVNGTTTFGAQETYGGNLKIDLNTEPGTFSSLTAYNKFNVTAVSDTDRISLIGFQYFGGGYETGGNYPERSFSQELTFASRKFGPISFIAGLYYFKGRGLLDPQFYLRRYPSVINMDLFSEVATNAKAAFTEVTFTPTDKLSVVAGLRYSTERKNIYGIFVTPSGGPRPNVPKLGSRKDSQPTPRFVVKYQLSDTANIYASYTRGFKSGTYNSSAIPIQTVDPEKIGAYEVGSKARFGALDFTIAAFYYDYKNIQTQAFILNPITQQYGGTIANAAKGEIYGVELGANLSVTDAFKLNAGASILHAKYKSFPGAPFTTPLPSGFGNSAGFTDATGNDMIRAPHFTATLSATYDAHIGDSLLRLASSLYYSSRYYFEPDNRLSQSAYALLDARATWTPANSKVSFSVFGRNLTDHIVYSAASSSSIGDVVSYKTPRTWGVSVGYEF